MQANGDFSRTEIASLALRLLVLGSFSYLSVKWILNMLDPTKEQKKEAKERAQRLFSQLHLNNVATSLNEYELSIAAQLVNPNSIEVSWNDIAGLENVIDDIKATVILPLKAPDLFSRSTLHQPPKGVLLHGPPGCGKTMLAKATAREAGARFINLEVPSLTDKWYGESQKLARAVFTLALKLQPCIIFIDEIDSFLRSRDTHDHEATAMMKAQFMILWDGLVSEKKCQVIVMGATNRPQDVDKAILRRMPAMFAIGLPSAQKRQEILSLMLEDEDIARDVNIDEIAEQTEGFSGSDLRELCRSSALARVRQYVMSKNFANGHDMTAQVSLRPISMSDFHEAINKMRESKRQLRDGTSGHSVIGLD